MYDNILPHSLPRYSKGDVIAAREDGDLNRLREVVRAARYNISRSEILSALGVSNSEEMMGLLFPFTDSDAYRAIEADPSQDNLAAAVAAGWDIAEVAEATGVSANDLSVRLAAVNGTSPVTFTPCEDTWTFPNLHHVPQYIFADSTSSMPTSGLPLEARNKLTALAEAVITAEERVEAEHGARFATLRRSGGVDSAVYDEAVAAADRLVRYAHTLSNTYGISAEQMTAAVGKGGNRYWLRRMGTAASKPFN